MASDSRRHKTSYRDERDNHNKRSRRRDDDYDDRSRRNDRDRDRDRYKTDDRDKHRSRDDRDKRRDRDQRSSKYDDRKNRGRSKSRDRYRKKRSRSRSNSVNKRDNRKYSNHGSRSPIFEKKTEIKKYSSSRSRSKTPPKKYEYIPKPSNNEVDAFKTLSKANNEYYGSKYKVQPKYIEGDFDDDEKEKIHKEMQDRLKQHLASEGKVYPPPKPEPKETMYANDGSFLEMFKQMQDQHFSHTAEVIQQQPVVRPPAPQPMFGKRRGGKILKTGIVEKPKPIEEFGADGQAKDAWSMYMHEVKKYKHTVCDVNAKTRPLLK